MKKFIFLVSSIVLFTNAKAQPSIISIERKQISLSYRIFDETWTKSIFKDECVYQVFPTNEGRLKIWEETHRILNFYAIPFDTPEFDYSNVFEGLDLNDSLMVLEAMDRAEMELNMTYVLPDYFLYVVMGEETNLVYFKKMNRRERAYWMSESEEEEIQPVVFYSMR